jgi:hypothetical protein
MPPEVSKAIREGYSPPPFFYREEYEPEKVRWVAWTGSVPQLKELLYRVLRCFPEDVQVLLKLQVAERADPNTGPWQRYYGTCSLETLLVAIEKNEAQVFTDGGSQLCVMCGGGGDYLALDEHGSFFLYADDEGVRELCGELGFEERQERLLTEDGHWHYRPGGNEAWQAFIEQAGLQAVGGDSAVQDQPRD